MRFSGWPGVWLVWEPGWQQRCGGRRWHQASPWVPHPPDPASPNGVSPTAPVPPTTCPSSAFPAPPATTPSRSRKPSPPPAHHRRLAFPRCCEGIMSEAKRKRSKQKRYDRLTPAQRSDLMARIRRTDTKPEMAVRQLSHRLGYRFRLHRKDLPGSPDLVFPSRRKVIFVHGCWWHRHSCPLGQRVPRTRLEYWLPKFDRNTQRDRQVRRQLRSLGWSALVIWECETRGGGRLLGRIKRFLDE